MYINANEFYPCGYGLKFSIRQICDSINLVTFTSVGECSEKTKNTLIAKAVGAIIVAEKLFGAKIPSYVKANINNLYNTNTDYVIVTFALWFKKQNDVIDYIEELKNAQIIS